MIKPLQFRVLKSEADLVVYQDRYEERSGGRPPLDYLEKSRVIGAYNRGRMVGGFVFGLTPPWRYMGWLSEKEAEAFSVRLAQAHQSEGGIAEVVLVWIDPAAPEVQRQYLWLGVVHEARRYDRLLVGTPVPQLERVYRATLGPPIQEYVGGINLDGVPRQGVVMVMKRPSYARVGQEAFKRLRGRKAS